MTEDEYKLLLARAQLDARIRDVERHRAKVLRALAYWTPVTILLAITLSLLSPWVFAAVLLLGFGYTLWLTWPRLPQPCTFCGQSRMNNLPVKANGSSPISVSWTRPWVDHRSVDWVCFDHLADYIERQCRAASEGDREG